MVGGGAGERGGGRGGEVGGAETRFRSRNAEERIGSRSSEIRFINYQHTDGSSTRFFQLPLLELLVLLSSTRVESFFSSSFTESTFLFNLRDSATARRRSERISLRRFGAIDFDFEQGYKRVQERSSSNENWVRKKVGTRDSR